MKRILLAAWILAWVANLFGQGIVFNNRVIGSVVAPVYGPEVSDPTLALHGNTATGYPPGDVVYTGPLLEGRGYTAQLYCGPAGAPADSLVPAAGYSKAGFRTGVRGAGLWETSTDAAFIPGMDYGLAALQVRVWDNRGGSVTSWEEAVAATNVCHGASTVFTSLPIGDFFTPNLVGLTSFNIAFPATSMAPPLAITRFGGNVILTWSTNVFGFTLQSASNLVCIATWVNVSQWPWIIGGLNTVTNAIGDASQFYRLSR